MPLPRHKITPKRNHLTRKGEDYIKNSQVKGNGFEEEVGRREKGQAVVRG